MTDPRPTNSGTDSGREIDPSTEPHNAGAEANDVGLSPVRLSQLTKLANTIGYQFRDITLLDRALVHASTGNDGLLSYERLEFLGDAVLGFLVADHLYHEHAESTTEGQLTELRSRFVSRAPLACVAERLGFIEHLRIGRGMQHRDLESSRIRADLFEAVLGAIYVDGGTAAARAFVESHLLRQPLPTPARDRVPLDAKTKLLHIAQSRGLGQPTYELIDESGPSHQRTFRVVCFVADQRFGEGSGSTKQAAQMEAAAGTIEQLLAEHGSDPNAAPSKADGD